MNFEPIDERESVFTEPRDDCQRPDYWHSSDGESTEHEVSMLVAALVRALQPELVLETGAGFGQTTLAIGKALRANGHGTLVSVEIDVERARVVRERCGSLPVHVIATSSLDYVPDAPIDLMWIDSQVELRAAELRWYESAASARCVVGVHDTGPHKSTSTLLTELVEELVIEPPLYLPTPRGVCLTRFKE